MFEVEITREGLRHLDQPPEKVHDAAVQAILGTIAERPQRVSKPLVGEPAGLWSARRGDHRVIYEINNDRKVVIVHRSSTAASSTGRADDPKEQEVAVPGGSPEAATEAAACTALRPRENA